MAVVDEVREQGAQVPSIFWYEIRHALIVNERRGRITPEKTSIALGMLAELPIEYETLPSFGAGLLDLAQRHTSA